MQFVNLIGGILLILLGLRTLRKGFARVMGGDLLDWLQEFTRTQPRALLGGVAAGIVMPSSTAMALLSVDMTRDSRATWRNVLAVLLGAQLGITVLVQVLAFNLQDYAGLLLALGGGMFLFVERSRPKGLASRCWHWPSSCWAWALSRRPPPALAAIRRSKTCLPRLRPCRCCFCSAHCC